MGDTSLTTQKEKAENECLQNFRNNSTRDLKYLKLLN